MTFFILGQNLFDFRLCAYHNRPGYRVRFNAHGPLQRT